MKISLALMLLVALLLGPPAAAPASLSTNYAEEPSYSVPATFPGPLAPQPRRKPEPSGMLLCCLGLILYLGLRRSKALAVSAA